MLVAWVLGAVVIIARLAGQPIGFFLGGIGALSAVVILVFRDTILSLVASVQLTSNDMLRVGDWIEMPTQNADGDVIEVALHTVKVQNWDKTITTIPTYKLISDSFKNWRGMQEAGGRRIMRSIVLDLSTIRFLDEEEIERWSRFVPLADYMAGKRSELAAWNAGQPSGGELIGDPRRLTNVGTFRAYVIAYLRAHPRLATDSMTMLVRQLQPTEHGLPIQIYAFTATTEWAPYESIQADVFDHLLAIVPEFGLRVFQTPSGADVAALRAGRADDET
jgi:miniconductance mechanosensitive channel